MNYLLKKTGIRDPQSFDWPGWFERNQKRNKPDFHHPDRISRADRALIAPSLRAFALGKASEGEHLKKCAAAFAKKSGWTAYEALAQSLIREENLHSELLSLTMASYHIRPGISSGLNAVFRALRRKRGLDTETRVLLAAQIVGVVYYQALYRVTNSSTIRSVCKRMLHDEYYHLVLQSVVLGRIRVNNPTAIREKLDTERRAFVSVTAAVVWDRYENLFLAAGYSRAGFIHSCMQLLEASIEIERGVC